MPTHNVVVVGARPGVLESFQEDLGRYAEKVLARRRFEGLAGEAVTNCAVEHIVVGDQVIPCNTIIWASGVKASPAAKWLWIPSSWSKKCWADHPQRSYSRPLSGQG